MKDHEKRELVSAITAIALEFRDAEQLRERIRGAVLPAIDAAVAAERERCAKVCEQAEDATTSAREAETCRRLAAEIRRA